MALSIVLKHMMPQIPRKFASGLVSEANENLKAFLTLCETSRSMRGEVESAVDLRSLRLEMEQLRLLRLESVWDAYLNGLAPFQHGPDHYRNDTYYLECVDEYMMEFFKSQFPDARPSASWLQKTFKSQYVQIVVLDDYGYDPVECFENGTLAIKPFDDLSLDDVLFDFFEHGHSYEGTMLCRDESPDQEAFDAAFFGDLPPRPIVITDDMLAAFGMDLAEFHRYADDQDDYDEIDDL